MLLQAIALQRLLVLNLLLRVLVRLQNLVVLLLTLLKKLVHLILQFLPQRVHLVLLLLHQLGLRCEDLLVAHLHMLPTLRLLKLIGSLLHLVGLLVVLLLGQVSLNLSLI